jgi:hypothetical protein
VCEVGGIVVRGVLRGHQADVGGHCGERSQHGLGVGPAHDVQCVRTPEVFTQAQPFAQEEGGELRPRSAVWAMCGRIRSPSASPLWGAFQMVPELTPWKKIAELDLAARLENIACHGFPYFPAATVAAAVVE